MSSTRSARAEAALGSFYRTALADVLTRHEHTDLERHALDLFQGVTRDVPAYAKFLTERGIAPESVRSLAEFARLPATTKENYQRAHPLASLCRGGSLESVDFFAVSSGSTGEPAAWPRFVSDEIGSAYRFEQVLRDAFAVHERPTLGIVCFALGSWVGGMFTTFACRHVAAKGYPLTLVTPGNNKAEILRMVRALAPEFSQIVLFGYPPFLKDVIDAGVAAGLDWQRYSPRIVTAGEVFSEEWRTLVCQRLGAVDPRFASASLYGTADGGVLANETPLSITVRRYFARHPDRARELFGQTRLPTLCQYDPLHRYFELEGEELLFSGDGGIPLVRYKILDRGGIVPYQELLDFLATAGYDPFQDFTTAELAAVRRLPFVYVFGRSNFALSFYGANVYPENISVGLEQPEFAPHVSGKFVMQINESGDSDPELEIVVELAPGAQAGESLGTELAASIRNALERQNSEFSHFTPSERRTPTVRFLEAGDPTYFPAGIKHRYVR
jgi:phenylacetate-CoA ligase